MNLVITKKPVVIVTTGRQSFTDIYFDYLNEADAF